MSCEKYVDLDIPPHESKLVLNGFVLAGDTLPFSDIDLAHKKAFTVSYSIGALEDREISFFKDAQINIYENESLADSNLNLNYLGINYLVRDSIWGYFPTIDFKPEKTYKVVAQHPSFLNAVYAEQYLPSYIGISAKIDTLKSKRNLTISFDDPPENNSYLLRVYTVRTLMDGSVYFSNEAFSSYDAAVELLVKDEFSIDVPREKYSYEAIVIDKGFNGNSKTVELNIPSSNPYDYVIEFINMNPDMDEFYRTYYKYKDFGDDPFTEPQNIYYNVNDGYGTIAGGTRTVVKVEKI